MNQQNGSSILNGKPLRIGITGSSGFIGNHLTHYLKEKGVQVFSLVRRKGLPDSANIYWNPTKKEIDKEKLEGLTALIHLAGENISSQRWTPSQKQKILDSRIQGTSFLAETIASLKSPPEVFISVSAIGYYGNRGNETLTESSEKGNGFLSDVCQSWEESAAPAKRAGIRVVHPRFGLVLSTEVGALAKMIPPFRLGLGGRLGNGFQYMSWVTLDDLVQALYQLLTHQEISGPVNITTPNPVINLEFTQQLGKALHRFTIAPVPALILKLVMGEMADELLLSSTRVLPEKLIQSGYHFEYPDIESAFHHLFKQS